MDYQHLGGTDLRISRIGFGCMPLKGADPVHGRLIREALDRGVNYFDTADLYEQGANESLLGGAVQGRRHEVILATKAGNQWRADGSGWDWNPRKDYLLQAVEASLKRLRTDYIDLYQLHGGTMEDPMFETIEAFELLKQQGKIRYYGISSIRPNVIRMGAGHSAMASVMMQYSLLDRRPEETVLPFLHQKGIGVLARGAVAQGLLVNKPARPYLDHTEQSVRNAAAAIHSLSGPSGSAAQTAIRYALHHPAVSCAVVGLRTAEQLEEAIAATRTPLSSDEQQALRNSLPDIYYREHRD